MTFVFRVNSVAATTHVNRSCDSVATESSKSVTAVLVPTDNNPIRSANDGALAGAEVSFYMAFNPDDYVPEHHRSFGCEEIGEMRYVEDGPDGTPRISGRMEGCGQRASGLRGASALPTTRTGGQPCEPLLQRSIPA